MKRYILLFPICFLLLGCPVYDPPNGYIEILNNSKSTVYVYDTCSDNLPLSPELTLFESMGGNAYDADGKKMNDTIIPRYKIDPDSLREFSVWGRPEKPQLYCDDKNQIIFYKRDCIKNEELGGHLQIPFI